MDITKCEDPKTLPIRPTTLYPNAGRPLNYPSNSYYPPGTVCAVEKLGKFCPTSGESGSPLMVTDDEGKMVAEGINSFIKVLKILFIFNLDLVFTVKLLKHEIKILNTPIRAVLYSISEVIQREIFHI